MGRPLALVCCLLSVVFCLCLWGKSESCSGATSGPCLCKSGPAGGHNKWPRRDAWRELVLGHSEQSREAEFCEFGGKVACGARPMRLTSSSCWPLLCLALGSS